MSGTGGGLTHDYIALARIGRDFDRAIDLLDARDCEPVAPRKSLEDREHDWEVWADGVETLADPEDVAEVLADSHDEAVAELLAHLLCCGADGDEKLARLLEAAKPALMKDINEAVTRRRPQ